MTTLLFSLLTTFWKYIGIAAIGLIPHNSKAQTDTVLYKSVINNVVNNVLAVNATNNYIQVSGTSLTLDTASGRIYQPNNLALTTFTCPPATTIGTIFTIVGKGSGGYAVMANTGQTISGPNNITNALYSINATTTSTFRMTAPNVWQATSFQQPMLINGNQTFNALGSTKSTAPNISITGGSVTEVYRDTIQANALSYGRNYKLAGFFTLSTGALSLGATTIKIYFGSDSLVVANSVALSLLNQTASPFSFELDLSSTSDLAHQTGDVRLDGVSTALLGLNTSVTTSQREKDMTQDNSTFKIIRVVITQTLTSTVIAKKFNREFF